MLWIIYALWLMLIGYSVMLSHNEHEGVGIFLFCISLPAALCAPMLVI